MNKGTGAGGAKTNYNGLNFEDKTSIDSPTFFPDLLRKEERFA